MKARNSAPLAIGDRVRERPKVPDLIVRPTSPSYRTVTRIAHDRRYGTVVGITTKRSKTGAACKYFIIQWDRNGSPSVHASARIEKAPD
ncbi:MAG: hypothetical protein EB075_04365 [Bacteroidetes bacterium]|jgi:hypothetical protein|nr:hypothetical protein [Bacteroidota bacterium]